jgi:hypothetical protein
MKLNAPQITDLRDAGLMISQIIQLQEQELAAEKLLFTSEILTEEALNGIDYNCVEFDNCKLLGCNFDKAGFTNVRFKHCDISNCTFENGYFNQVEFISCKGVGSKFHHSILKHVSVTESNFSYSNFEHSKFQKVLLTASNFSNACLAEVTVKELELKEIEFNQCDFFKTALKGIDFRDCRIEGIIVSDTHKELEGVIVDTYQAAGLARYLGVEVK